MIPGPFPLLLVGVALLGAGGVLLARQLRKRLGQTGAVPPPAGATWAAWAASAVLIALGLAGIVAGSSLGGLTGPAAPASAGGGVPGEVDFGFVELDHGGRAVSVASYKHGGPMLLHPGEVLHYQAIGDAPLPPLELHLAGRIVDLPGSSGQINVDGAAGQALPVLMRAKGDRESLPGGAPPRVSVKVQVIGPPRKR